MLNVTQSISLIVHTISLHLNLNFFNLFFKEDNEEIEVLDMGEKLGKTHAVRAQFHSAA